MSMIQAADATLDVANKAADLIQRVASSSSETHMGEIQKSIGFTSIKRAFTQQKGVCRKLEDVRWNVVDSITRAVQLFEDLKAPVEKAKIEGQVPEGELFDRNEELDRHVAVVNIVAPSGNGFIVSFAYGSIDDAGGRYGYILRVAMVDFTIANDWCVVTHSKKNFLKSKTTQTIQELPTAISAQRFEEITQVLMGDRPEETSMRALMQLK